MVNHKSDSQESYAQLSDERSIYYFEEGAGPPLLYVHAATDTADGARGVFKTLRNHFQCIALDRVGYHRSGRLDRVTTLEEQVEAIGAVHRACTEEPAWLFGHSSGGNYAIAYALAYPKQVCGLVLIEPALYAVIPNGSRSPGVTAMIETVGPLFRDGRIHDAIEKFMGIIHPELSAETLDKYASDFLSSDDRWRWEAMATEQPLNVSWAPTSQEWRRFTQPAIVMEGDRTGEVLRAVAAKVSEQLPNGELVTLKGVNHSAPWEAPDIVAETTFKFINSVIKSE